MEIRELLSQAAHQASSLEWPIHRAVLNDDPGGSHNPALPSATDLRLADIPGSAIAILQALGTVYPDHQLIPLVPASWKTNISTALANLSAGLSELEASFSSNLESEEVSVTSVANYQFTFSTGTSVDISSTLKKIGNSLETLRSQFFYLSSIKGRSDLIDISAAVQNFSEAQKRYTSINHDLQVLQERSSQNLILADDLRSQIEARLSTISNSAATVEEARTASAKAVSESQAASQQVQSILTQAETFRQRLDAEQARLAAFTETVEHRDAIIKTSEKELQTSLQEINEQRSELLGLIDEAKKLLTSATTSALGESFAREATKRTKGAVFSGLILTASLLFMFVIFYWIFSSLHVQDNLTIDSLPGLLVRLAALVPAIIAAHASLRNLAIHRLMREEYAHRAALSTALEGYRTLVPPEQSVELVMETMKGLRENPAALLDTSAHEANVAIWNRLFAPKEEGKKAST